MYQQKREEVLWKWGGSFIIVLCLIALTAIMFSAIRASQGPLVFNDQGDVVTKTRSSKLPPLVNKASSRDQEVIVTLEKGQARVKSKDGELIWTEEEVTSFSINPLFRYEIVFNTKNGSFSRCFSKRTSHGWFRTDPNYR